MKRRTWAACVSLSTLTCLALGCGQDANDEGLPSESISSQALDAEAVAVPEAAAACTVSVSTPKELMVNALSIVEDPVRTRWTGSLTDAKDGAWQFGRLMTNMAGPNNASTFVRNWLAKWETARTVNGDLVPARLAMTTFVNSWPKKPDGSLDLTRAPLRLLAIVNRLDLRKPGNAGEGRFVFGVLDSAGNATSFTVILEYKMPAADAAAVRQWATDWHALGALTAGTAAYSDALQAITDRFAGKGVVPANVNGSSISQVRTNEILLNSPWELRQFTLGTTGQLRESPVTLTPNDQSNATPRLATFINTNAAAIKAQTHTVPLSFQGTPFLGGASSNLLQFWDAPGITDNQARSMFSLNTCNGCHGAETGLFFLQINPRGVGQVAGLSSFLTGIGSSVTDPKGTTRSFNDLARRNVDLKKVLCAAPGAPLGGTTGSRVH